MKNDKVILHGNNAKINPRKDIVSRGLNYGLTNYTEASDLVYNRLDDDAEFCKREVDANKK